MIDRETPHDRVSDVQEERRLAGILSQAGSRTDPSEAQLERWAGHFRATLADARAEGDAAGGFGPRGSLHPFLQWWWCCS